MNQTNTEDNILNSQTIQASSSELSPMDREAARHYQSPLAPHMDGTAPHLSLREINVEPRSMESARNTRRQSIQDAKKTLTITGLWSHFGLEGSPAKSCRSPFRSDRNPSFSLYYGEDGEERFKDHGKAGVQGDSYDFFQIYTELDSSAAFGPFCDLADEVRRSGKAPAPAHQIQSSKPKPLPPNFSERRLKMATFLRKERPLCEQIAAKRNWKVETIQALADETSLGWYQCNLAFLYDTGVKVRNFLEGGERSIKWPYGASSLWRDHRIANASTIYLCEGETDAISLLDADLETDPAVGVVAVPSASTFKPAWASRFAGKEVTLCMDGDPAGIAARQKIGALLSPVVSALKTVNPEVIR